MSPDKPHDLSASVKARLLQISKARRQDFQQVLTRYGIERFLYRLSQSAYGKSFILKGATLFVYWTGDVHRPTRDLDLLGHGDPQVSSIIPIFEMVCQQAVEDDGLIFLPETIAGESAREDEEYSGVRITLTSMLGKARIPLQIDIGYGDAVTPAAQEIELPAMIKMPPARLLAYTRETVVAEKCEAMVDLGLGNSRLKDFYDLWYLATHFDFDGSLLARALAATFQRRETALPTQIPLALTPVYYNNADRQAQWQVFVKRTQQPDAQMLHIEEVVKVLLLFLMPLLTALVQKDIFDLSWDHTALSWKNRSVSILF